LWDLRGVKRGRRNAIINLGSSDRGNLCTEDVSFDLIFKVMEEMTSFCNSARVGLDGETATLDEVEKAFVQGQKSGEQ
jgi:hypothetical protein